ncbi:hypothetical protein [Ichthyenterobacterium magnum]|uniref:hypothetical protein n=1 Tax=Ichthyenterobacterium magnum TaxID=1230530 RepID=UPI0011C3513A|nr:hypothetical protein [Ichthyenterobacterium magnum]
MNTQINCLVLASFFLIVVSCKKTTSETKKDNQIKSLKDSISSTIKSDYFALLDTITDVSTPMHYEIARTNYVRESIITKTVINMKGFLHIQYKLDSIIPIILTKNNHAINLGFTNSSENKINVLKNDYSFIRANNIYFNAAFIFNQNKHKITYAISYSGKQKGKFWHHAGLMKN